MNAQIFNNYAFLNENSSLQRWLLHDQQHANAIRDDVLHTKKNCFFRNYLVISGCIIFLICLCYCTLVYQLLASKRKELFN